MPFFLTSKTRSNLLAFFFAHADESYYVRELSTLISEDAGNLSRELRRLEAGGICQSHIKGRVKLYSLDKTYPLYSDMKNIFFKTEGAQGSLTKLALSQKNIELAIIYGSFATGSEKKTSDIDLIVVGKFNRDRFTAELRLLESKLNREINFTSYARQEFDKERRKSGSFLSLALKNKIILLKGSLDG